MDSDLPQGTTIQERRLYLFKLGLSLENETIGTFGFEDEDEDEYEIFS